MVKVVGLPAEQLEGCVRVVMAGDDEVCEKGLEVVVVKCLNKSWFIDEA